METLNSSLTSQQTQKSYKDFDPTKLIGKPGNNFDLTLTQNDLILYALSIGFSQDPMKIDDFKFTYEADENFQSFPSLSATAANKHFGQQLNIEGFPEIDKTQILHGEEDVEIFKPLLIDHKYQV